jgi:hypothetical protein
MIWLVFGCLGSIDPNQSNINSGRYDTYVQPDVIEYVEPIIIKPNTRHIIPPAICCALHTVNNHKSFRGD